MMYTTSFPVEEIIVNEEEVNAMLDRVLAGAECTSTLNQWSPLYKHGNRLTVVPTEGVV